MNGDYSKFVDFDLSVKWNVWFGDNIIIKVEVKGNVLFKSKDGSYEIFLDVYNVLKLKSNILSNRNK